MHEGGCERRQVLSAQPVVAQAERREAHLNERRGGGGGGGVQLVVAEIELREPPAALGQPIEERAPRGVGQHVVRGVQRREVGAARQALPQPAARTHQPVVEAMRLQPYVICGGGRNPAWLEPGRQGIGISCTGSSWC